MSKPKCPYCKVTAVPFHSRRNGKMVVVGDVIWHLLTCKGMKPGSYDPATRTNRMEREMPDVTHGSYL